MLDRLRHYRTRYGLRTALGLYLRGKLTPGTARLSLPDITTPLFMRRGTSDRRTFDKVFIARGYRCDLDGPVNAILDGGANVGYASVWFANAWPEATVVAVEPDADNFALLERNTAAYPRVQRVRAGLWPRAASLRIENPDDQPWAFRVTECPPGPGAIPAVTIPDLLRERGLERFDIVKLDIEGSEREVFADPRCHAWLGHTRLLVLELHDRYRPGCSTAVEGALARYSFERSSQGEDVFFRFLGSDRASAAGPRRPDASATDPAARIRSA
jgi:FkbM family methyltransferase